MIIFHEGMPRSGKSYAATVDHIIPALKNGRRLYVRIDGINHDKLADLAGITPERCHELLTPLTEEDVQKLDQIDIDNDSLVVIDELQNYFPSQKAPLTAGMTKWIAEHGHHGLDVLCMGQLLKDCHRTWVNRVNRKIQFIKKDMLGKPDQYKWRMFTGSPDARGTVKFIEVQKGDGKYDSKYFGAYASHSEGTDNKGTYEDDRANVFKSRIFKKWIPLYVAVFLVAVFYVYRFFHGAGAETFQQAKQPQKVEFRSLSALQAERSRNPPPASAPPASPAAPAPQSKPKEPEPKPKDVTDWPDLVNDLSKSNRIRLAGVIRTARRVKVIIEWRDSSFRVVDQLDTDDLETLGWHVATMTNDRMVMLLGPAGRQVATAWPIDERIGKVPEEDNDRIRREGRSLGNPPGQPPAPLAIEAQPGPLAQN
ncbi:MAG: zonular occludens toxin domain-containing protein [Proteobacteria bacterium]|nr:zonular occludens toxin domain-containing protein [Pseudomonadota bacterium]